MPKVTICVLTYGDYPRLARRILESIRRNAPRAAYKLVVGANAIGAETLRYLKALHARGEIDRVMLSEANLNKCPMMRRMFAKVDTEFIWWFDDDCYMTESTAFERWLGAATTAEDDTVIWGQLAWCDHAVAFAAGLEDPQAFVRSADWYRGLPPPSWRPGGKGEFDFQNRGTGDGRWLFITGGCWLIRTSTIRVLDWPDRRLIKMGDDVLLGEAIRQNRWELGNIGFPGVAVPPEPGRGDAGFRWTNLPTPKTQARNRLPT